ARRIGPGRYGDSEWRRGADAGIVESQAELHGVQVVIAEYGAGHIDLRLSRREAGNHVQRSLERNSLGGCGSADSRETNEPVSAIRDRCEGHLALVIRPFAGG